MTQYEHVYDPDFFEYISLGSRRSAEAVVAELTRQLSPAPASVLDVGCGQGVWTRAFAAMPGVAQAVGVDGAYVDPARLVIPAEDFVARDLSQRFDVGQRFDLVISLEVAEHLPPASSHDFVASLAAHGDLVLFSAAIPGQGGEHHVNERTRDFWRAAFSREGMVALDPLRPHLRDDARIEPWYRYNMLLFASEAGLARLPEAVRATRLPDAAPVPDLAPISWQMRCAMIRRLPRPVVDRLAALKHAAIRRRRRAGL